MLPKAPKSVILGTNLRIFIFAQNVRFKKLEGDSNMKTVFFKWCKYIINDITQYINIYIYIHTENNTLQARIFRLSVSHCEQRFHKNLIYLMYIKEIFVRPTKIHAVYSMEPIIQRMQTELKASAGNMTRAQCI